MQLSLRDSAISSINGLRKRRDVSGEQHDHGSPSNYTLLSNDVIALNVTNSDSMHQEVERLNKINPADPLKKILHNKELCTAVIRVPTDSLFNPSIIASQLTGNRFQQIISDRLDSSFDLTEMNLYSRKVGVSAKADKINGLLSLTFHEIPQTSLDKTLVRRMNIVKQTLSERAEDFDVNIKEQPLSKLDKSEIDQRLNALKQYFKLTGPREKTFRSIPPNEIIALKCFHPDLEKAP